jgi:uncharacterized protein Usg
VFTVRELGWDIYIYICLCVFWKSKKLIFFFKEKRKWIKIFLAGCKCCKRIFFFSFFSFFWIIDRIWSSNQDFFFVLLLVADGRKCILQLYIWNQYWNSSIIQTFPTLQEFQDPYNLPLAIAFATLLLNSLHYFHLSKLSLAEKMGTSNGFMLHPIPGGLRALIIWSILLCFGRLSFGAKSRHFKWEVEYLFWSPDCIENVVMGINGQFPGPTIRAKAGDTIVVELTNKLSTEGVVIHWHGIRQV